MVVAISLQLLPNLKPDGTRARDNLRLIRKGQQHGAFFLRQRARQLGTIVAGAIGQHDACPHQLDFVQLAGWGIGGHHDGNGNPQAPTRKGNRNAKIARRIGHNARLPLHPV